jgi:hypothetical protein
MPGDVDGADESAGPSDSVLALFAGTIRLPFLTLSGLGVGPAFHQKG